MWSLDRGATEGRWWDVIKDSEDFTGVVLVPVGYDFVIDIDLGENPWLSEDEGLRSSRRSATSW
uniref:Uncharacterized protein n=1 Tax=Ignisphaera aggregans TaxID=334771 RepID=A0A7J3Z6R3_9CREN